MGLSALPAGSRVYLDANVWVYALEGYVPYNLSLKALFARIDSGEITGITSLLTLAECLVKPFADGNTALQRLYAETLQERPSLSVVPLTRTVLIEAARLRARHVALKMPDALHAATALTSGAKYFVSNDTRFTAVPGLERMDINS